MNNANAKAMYIVFKQYGLIVDAIDDESNVVYISVPKTSDMKTISGEDVAGLKLAKKFKDLFRTSRYTVKYKVRNENWTAEMAHSAKNDAEDVVFNF